jgi:hypothetical protein
VRFFESLPKTSTGKLEEGIVEKDSGGGVREGPLAK